MSVVTIKSYKDRALNLSEPVLVYRNLRNGLLSIKQNGVVVGHTDSLVLENIKFIVKESGRQRVLREQQKNVHAYVSGHILVSGNVKEDAGLVEEITVVYNPYKMDKFSTRTGVRLKGCKYLTINKSGKMLGTGLIEH